MEPLTAARDAGNLSSNGGRSKQINILAKKSALHFLRWLGRSGGQGHGGQPGLAEAHAFGQDDGEAVEKDGLGGVGLDNAAQPDSAVGGGRQRDV